MQMLVESEWLKANSSDPDLIILDASYPKVTGEKSPHEGFQIIGARRFDIDYFSDQDNPLPHMLCATRHFQEKARALGINLDSRIVIYDNFGIYSAPRAWWMFKVMGHERVSVLNGGLPAWIESGYPTEKTNVQEVSGGDFVADFRQDLVKSFDQMEVNLSEKSFQVIDARSAGRFEGTAPEPRPELSSGHLPGSVNLPFPEVLVGNRFKSEDDLRKIFSSINTAMPLVFSCGSGLSACIPLMAAEQVLQNEMAVYDGSWTEWAGREGLIEKKR